MSEFSKLIYYGRGTNNYGDVRLGEQYEAGSYGRHSGLFQQAGDTFAKSYLFSSPYL